MANKLKVYFVLLYVLTAGICVRSSCMGCLELDEITFDKMITKFRYSLIKFDIAFPYGDKHEAYSEFAQKIAPKIDDLLVGLVGVKDYGEKENSGLADRYQIEEKIYPVILLFKNYSSENYIRYSEKKSITADNIRNFVKEQTNLYIGLDGCLKELDVIVADFAEKTEPKQLEDMDKVKEIQEKFEHVKDKEIAQLYLISMKRIMEKGENFIMEEQRRLENLLQSKIADNKKRELTHRLNILESFQTQQIKIDEKDEL